MGDTLHGNWESYQPKVSSLRRVACIDMPKLMGLHSILSWETQAQGFHYSTCLSSKNMVLEQRLPYIAVFARATPGDSIEARIR